MQVENGKNSIAIVDFGSQTANLIGRRLRQIGVETDFLDPENALVGVDSYKHRGIILSGGPASVYEEGAPTIDPNIFALGIPVLGICYGWQLMARNLGGVVENGLHEYGPETLDIRDAPDGLLSLTKKTLTVYMSHGDTVTRLPKGFKVEASTASVQNAAVFDNSKHLYGLQFHPEVHHTEDGIDILRSFAERICMLEPKPVDLNPQSIIQRIKEAVGDHKVICGVSGGVDSTVAAYLIGKAIGRNLIPVYVDSGLMRAGTTEHVRYIFSDLIQADLEIVQARERFLQSLNGISDPEIKRKTIGRLYVDLFQEQAAKHSDATFLGQGTIYSDVIESRGSKHASSIKSHHNVGGLPQDLGLRLVEPLRSFYKDEVREIGRLSGLPEAVLMQHPFPGPGYAVRIRGEVTKRRLAQVTLADQIVIDEMKRAGLYDKVFQCFAVMTGAFSTAVKGDARAFSEVVAVRAYESEDVMTSDWVYPPRELLQRISSRIVNEVPDVSRVVYDITTKPPATMEWE